MENNNLSSNQDRNEPVQKCIDCGGTGKIPRPLSIGERVQGYMRCGLCRGSGIMPTSRD